MKMKYVGEMARFLMKHGGKIVRVGVKYVGEMNRPEMKHGGDMVRAEMKVRWLEWR